MLAIGTPYKENSVMAIARGAVAREELGTFYTTIHTAGYIPAAKRLPVTNIRASIVRELERRAYAGIPSDKVRALATSWDVALIGIRRLHLSALSSKFVFRVKRQFDGEMANAVSRSSVHAVMGMWGSCEETLRRARTAGRFTVMNYVNSHPSEQNRLTMELGGAPPGHHELIPENVIAQVEREMKQADLLLVPSQFVARQLTARGTPEDQIAIEPYGVNLAAFVPPPAPRSFEKNKRMQVLCVALISYRKGIKHLLEAARQSPHMDFHLVGPIIEPSLLHDLPENVKYHGIRVQSEVVDLMHAADVLVLPSVEDAYGLVVLEAMATELPVVVSDHAGASESVVPGETGLVFAAGDVSGLVSSLELLSNSPELRKRIGSAGRVFVEGASPWESYADRVLDRIAARA